MGEPFGGLVDVQESKFAKMVCLSFDSLSVSLCILVWRSLVPVEVV